MQDFYRQAYYILLQRLEEPRRFMQVLAGPRQVGKTTLAQQIMRAMKTPCHYASADEPGLRDTSWLEQQWQLGRLQCKTMGALLVLDEIQKIPHWSESVKKLWDEDTAAGIRLKVVLLGSTPLLIQHGLAESLAGRFEIIPVTHWSFAEMQQAFSWDLEQFIYFGGYPGAAGLITDEARWARYILDSLIETTISRDILLLTRVDKPALLRHLFQLSCHYSGRILSYQKMLGQLHDAGNTTTLAHYLELLNGAWMVTGLPKFSGKIVRQRASSPKLQVYNTALISAQLSQSFQATRQNTEFWGRLVESAVGAYLVNSVIGTKIKLYYWREGIEEVDFLLTLGKDIVALEVKSGRKKETLSGLQSFAKKFRLKRQLLIGGQGMSLSEFLTMPIEKLFS